MLMYAFIPYSARFNSNVRQILLESAASFNLNKHDAISSGDGAVSRLLVFSAKHPESLRRTIENHESYLSAHPDSLQDMAHSLGTRREQLPLRSFCVTTGEDAFEMSKVTKPGSGACPKLVFTFTGQGAQWAQMAKDLIDEHPLFRKTIQELDGVLYKLPDRPQWSLESKFSCQLAGPAFVNLPRRNPEVKEAEPSF